MIRPTAEDYDAAVSAVRTAPELMEGWNSLLALWEKRLPGISSRVGDRPALTKALAETVVELKQIQAVIGRLKPYQRLALELAKAQGGFNRLAKREFLDALSGKVSVQGIARDAP